MRSISIEQWHELCLSGAAPPVKIYLDGFSMQPLIRKGKDKVTIVPVDRKLRTGDIVLFKAVDGRYIVHRVWKINGDMIQTLGDRCTYPDVPINIRDVYGIVAEMERDGKSYDMESIGLRAFGSIWMQLYPVRRLTMQGWRKTKVLLRKAMKT